MTDTAFYDRMDQLAGRLMDKFGTLATLIRTPKGEVNESGDREDGEPTHFPGLAVKTTEKSMEDRLVDSHDAIFIFKGPGEPKDDDKLVHAARHWKVNEVNTVSPEGTRIFISILGVSSL